MRVLITGGSGFIGKAIARKLIEDGDDVVIADLLDHPDLPCVKGDLRDPSVVTKVFDQGVDGVIHLAALTSVLESKAKPWEYYTSNLEVTARLLESCRDSGVERFVLASTNAVAGPVKHLPIWEESPLNPLTPYGATKAAAEMVCSAYSASFGVKSASIRLTNVYGPGMDAKDSFVPRLMRAAAQGGGVQVYGDGSMLRDYVYISDVVDGFLTMLRNDHAGPVVIGSGSSISVNELIDHAKYATGIDIPVAYGEPREGEMPVVEVDISLARSLGYEPKVTMASGMKAAWQTFAI